MKPTPNSNSLLAKDRKSPQKPSSMPGSTALIGNTATNTMRTLRGNQTSRTLEVNIADLLIHHSGGKLVMVNKALA